MLLVFALLGILVLSGCASKRILKKYYILEPSLKTVLADSLRYTTLPYRVLVNPFIVRPAFKSKKIALRTRSNELQYYIYHLWGEAPDDALRFFIWRRLNVLNVFKQASVELTNTAPQYLIDGTIDLLEWQTPNDHVDKPVAHVQMVFYFKDFKSGKILVKHAFDRTAPLPAKSSMNDFALAVNRILNREVDIFIQEIILKLK